MSISIDHIIVVKLDIFKRVAPDLLMKKGMMEYPMKFTRTKPM